MNVPRSLRAMRAPGLPAALLAAALLTACGGSGDEARWSMSVSDASRALSTPGSATASADTTSIVLRGGDGSAAAADASACAGGQYGFASSPCRVVAMNADGSARGTVTFDWTYATRDASGPGADLFALIVDGKEIALSDPGGPLQQSGRRTVTVTSSIGWVLNCTDCTQGAAEVTVAGISVR